METLKRKRMAEPEELPSVVDLNVGGTRFTTRLATLRKYPDSMLAAMFSGTHELDRDRDGNIFIDRKGEYFADILEFLRDEQCLPPTKRCAKVLKEAEYFGLVELKDHLKNKPPLFPVYNLLEKNRAAVEDYFTIKEKVKCLATLIADNQTKSACSTTKSKTVGAIISTIHIVTYNSKINPLFDMAMPPSVSSFEEIIHGMDSELCNQTLGIDAPQTVGIDEKNVTDFVGFIHTLGHDLQQEGYIVTIPSVSYPDSSFFSGDMIYTLTKTANLMFDWKLIPPLFY